MLLDQAAMESLRNGWYLGDEPCSPPAGNRPLPPEPPFHDLHRAMERAQVGLHPVHDRRQGSGGPETASGRGHGVSCLCVSGYRGPAKQSLRIRIGDPQTLTIRTLHIDIHRAAQGAAFGIHQGGGQLGFACWKLDAESGVGGVSLGIPRVIAVGDLELRGGNRARTFSGVSRSLEAFG